MQCFDSKHTAHFNASVVSSDKLLLYLDSYFEHMWQVNKLRIEANDSTDDAPEIVPYLAINNSFLKKK